MVMLSCASGFLWRTHFCTWETGARLSCGFFWGGGWPMETRRVAEAGLAEHRLLIRASEAEGAFRPTPGRGCPSREASPRGKMCLCMRARVTNTKVISPCSFFLSVSGGGGPQGAGGRPGRRLRGRAGAEARSGWYRGSPESLFHIPGVRAEEKTVGSMASVSRYRLRERVAPWPGTSVQEAAQAGRGRGAEGRLPALERWGRGRGATASPGHCAPADFHGRLPRSRQRRPGAGYSLGFKRHSRNVNNPGGRASRPERARTPGLGPSPFPGDCRLARLHCPSHYLPQTFPSSAS